MTDRLDELRRHAEDVNSDAYDYGNGPMLKWAVAEIERLRAAEIEMNLSMGRLTGEYVQEVDRLRKRVAELEKT